MMSPKVIDDIARQAAAKARANGYRPVLITEEIKQKALEEWRAGRHPNLHIPFIGDYVPKGYEKTDMFLFVDSSGLGSRGESALTQDEFIERLRPGYAYAVVEAGEFQVYVQEYQIG